MLLVTLMLLVFGQVAVTQAAGQVKLNKKKVTIYVGKTSTLKLAGTSKKVKWSSSAPKVASVSQKGKVTGKKAGTATITAKVGKKSYKCKVTVKSALSANKQEITIQDSGSVKITFKTTGSKTYTVHWEVEDKSIATCEWGKNWKNDKTTLYIKGIKNGVTTVTVTNNFNKQKVRIKVTVAKPIKVTSVSLPTSQRIKVGETTKLTATIYPTNAAGSSDIVWTSSNSSVATVKDGVVTGISEGDAYITASVGGKEDWCHVYVEAKAESNTPVNNYQILKNYLLTKGYTNTKGNKVISAKYTSDSQIYQYGIVYDAASDKYSFVWTTQSINGKTKTSMSMDIENPSNLILRPNYIYLYSNTVGFDATATISAATYDGEQNVYFTINSSVGGVSASDKQTLANVSLQTAFAMWDTLLYKNVGIDLQDLGFVNYNH